MQVVQYWNRLPASIIRSPSVPFLKAQLDHHLGCGLINVYLQYPAKLSPRFDCNSQTIYSLCVCIGFLLALKAIVTVNKLNLKANRLRQAKDVNVNTCSFSHKVSVLDFSVKCSPFSITYSNGTLASPGATRTAITFRASEKEPSK